MDEIQASAVAEALGGSPWQSGGDIWLVLLRRGDGKIVVVSDEVVTEYDDDDAFEANRTSASIPLH